MSNPSYRRPGGAVTPAVRLWQGLEPLEPREHLSVSQDADGWTVLTPSDDTRIIYVSSSQGDDRDDGRTSKRPVRSLAKGYDLLRDNHADWLLLRAGDVFDDEFPKWRLSGRSEQEPMLLGSFGPGERPVIRTGSSDGFRTSGDGIDHLAIIGVHFTAHTRDPYSPDYLGPDDGDGLVFLGEVHDLLIEDVVVDQYTKNVIFEPFYGRFSDITIRRSVITDAYNGSGMYAAGVDGLLVEGNVFDHNGWNELVDIEDQRIDHNLYLHASNSAVVVRDNVFADGGSHGVQARSGGLIANNLFLGNPIGLSFGFVNGANSFPGGVSGEVSGNVFLGGRDIHGDARGIAMEIGNTRPGGGTVVRDNIIAHDTQQQFAAIQLNLGKDIKNPEQVVGLNDLRIQGNIVYGWYRALSTTSRFEPGATGLTAFSGLLVRNNDFQQTTSSRVISHGREVDLDVERWEGNRYFSANDEDEATFQSGSAHLSWAEWQRDVEPRGGYVEAEYFAPQRNIETYNAALGSKPTLRAFMTHARLQSRRFWRDEFATGSVLTYVRQGFSPVKGPPRLVATNMSHRNLAPARKQMSFWFSRDVSESISDTDLKIWNRDTGRVIHPNEMEMSYDRLTHVATWTFSGLDRGLLPAGRWELWLHAAGITDDGMALDSNSDGIEGDSYSLKFTLRPRL